MTPVDPPHIQPTWDLLETWHSDDRVRAISAETGTAEGPAKSIHLGFPDERQHHGISTDSIFLIASPTKPFVATAIMMLVQQGHLHLSDRVSRYLPRFDVSGKRNIRLIHLLTHTSGLPDMLPNNLELRKDHAPLSEYMENVYDVDLLFKPGYRVHYQSMGILTLATILESIADESLTAFLERTVFTPLKMQQTTLGIRDNSGAVDPMQHQVHVQVDDQEGATDWGWNSLYWRKLGAPWGGLLSTAGDLGKFYRHLLQISSGSPGILHPLTLQAMIRNQLTTMPHISPEVARSTPWGLGWQLNWPNHPRGFGSILPPSAFGHWGATGTLGWIDPQRGVYGIVLTSSPIQLENRPHIAFANLCRTAWN